MGTYITNIGLLATPRGHSARRGTQQGDVTLLRNAWVELHGETIAAVGQGTPAPAEGDRVIDAGGRLVTPGLVDAHTHLIFGGWRQNELGQKAAEALAEMLRMGVTTCEAKSGYGLDPEQEMKQLRVIRRLKETQSVELAATFMGAHALPEEYRGRREAYIRLLCQEMIPRAAREGLAEFCDVFCETGVFTAEESRTILEAGLRHGLRPKVHADEIDAIGGSQLAGEMGAVSAEHLIVCPPEGIRSLARGGTVACCLPATSFYLGADYAPVRDMVNAGVPVAVATDFNPGSCPGSSLQLAMNIACLKYRMTPEEVLTAVTLNGAAAIGRADRIGSLEPGKQADLLLWDAPDLDYVCYRFGSNLVHTVMKKGRLVGVTEQQEETP